MLSAILHGRRCLQAQHACKDIPRPASALGTWRQECCASPPSCWGSRLSSAGSAACSAPTCQASVRSSQQWLTVLELSPEEPAVLLVQGLALQLGLWLIHCWTLSLVQHLQKSNTRFQVKINRLLGKGGVDVAIPCKYLSGLHKAPCSRLTRLLY